LKGRLSGQRLRFEHGEHRRLAESGHSLGPRLLAQVGPSCRRTRSCAGIAGRWRVSGRIGMDTAVPLDGRHSFVHPRRPSAVCRMGFCPNQANTAVIEHGCQ
jgi:hypothetical protein